MFQNQRFITKGVNEKVSLLLQLFLWQLIEEMPPEKDYLQVFQFTLEDGKQKITHTQEEPHYKREYLLEMTDVPIFIGKIFVIDDGEHSTMMLASEY